MEKFQKAKNPGCYSRPWSGVADCPLSTEMAISAAPLLGATLLTSLYTETATTALASLLLARPWLCGGRRSHVRSVRETELAWREETFARPGEASTSPWRDPLAREPLARPLQARESLQAWRARSLVKFFRRCNGPWQAGPWYPGFHCADKNKVHNVQN